MNRSELAARAAEALGRIRQARPLVHQITNFVVMNDTANITLHVGALPVMAHALEEVEDMVGIAGALVLNPGTLEPDWVEAMELAGRRARERGVPVVLDPVGAGATPYRTASCTRLIREVGPDVVRGNAGEIASLLGAAAEVRGVESVAAPADVLGLARQAARQLGAVVAITGRRDIVADGERALGVDNGHELLTTITGSGCMSTTMVAAFCAVEADRVVAAASALACYGLAAERAAAVARGPASFRVALLDAVYALTPEELAAGARIEPLGGDA